MAERLLRRSTIGSGVGYQLLRLSAPESYAWPCIRSNESTSCSSDNYTNQMPAKSNLQLQHMHGHAYVEHRMHDPSQPGFNASLEFQPTTICSIERAISP